MKGPILETAKKLQQPNDAFANEFNEKWESLAAIGTQILIRRSKQLHSVKNFSVRTF